MTSTSGDESPSQDHVISDLKALEEVENAPEDELASLSDRGSIVDTQDPLRAQQDDSALSNPDDDASPQVR